MRDNFDLGINIKDQKDGIDKSSEMQVDNSVDNAEHAQNGEHVQYHDDFTKNGENVVYVGQFYDFSDGKVEYVFCF